MGSGGSKGVAAADGGAGDGGSRGGDEERSRRWRGERVLGLACLCLPAASGAAEDEQDKKRGRPRKNVCTDETGTKSSQPRSKSCRKLVTPCPDRATCSNSSGVEPNAECHESTSCALSGDNVRVSIQTAAITRSTNPLNRSRSRFDFIPDRIVTRLGRAASVGSSTARSSFSVQNPECDDRGHGDCDGWATGRNGIHQTQTAVDAMSSREISNAATEAGVTGHFHQSNVRTENFERRPGRRHGLQDPLEGSIRFSRTRSVGRLRDRVLRRPSFSDGLFDPLSLENRLAEYHGDGTGRRSLRRAMRSASSDGNNDMFTSSSGSLSRSMDNAVNTHGYESETPQLIREASIRSTLESRSAFLERRRRIRSQVRELQWLGSRVGHDRSCILSGRHHTGHCTCRMTRRPANPADDTSTRSSISRIVMLAEALFEVLDEIHQQAVVLASRPSMSSIGSVPAPKEVVERMPLRIYEKPQVYHNEEASQCYICLVEYEDGDCVRILPCRHEFHRVCVDKWLKEIHRVCPLCRGDVCISDVPPVGKPG